MVSQSLSYEMFFLTIKHEHKDLIYGDYNCLCITEVYFLTMTSM